METAVIIAGGQGIRLRPFTNDRPKTLVEINGKPMLWWIIRWLKENGIKHLVLGVAYRKEMIFDFMEKNDNFGMEVDYSEHTIGGGTAEAFKLAITRYVKDDDFIAMNSDELTNMRLKNLEDMHLKSNALLTLVAAPLRVNVSALGINKNNMVTLFEYGKRIDSIPVSTGIYAFNYQIVSYIPEEGSIEKTAFTRLVTENKVSAYRLQKDEDWITVNTEKDLSDAERVLSEWESKH